MNDEMKQATEMTFDVGFLETKEEYELYAGAIYSAIVWGRKVDKEDTEQRLKDKSIRA